MAIGGFREARFAGIGEERDRSIGAQKRDGLSVLELSDFRIDRVDQLFDLGGPCPFGDAWDQRVGQEVATRGGGDLIGEGAELTKERGAPRSSAQLRAF